MNSAYYDHLRTTLAEIDAAGLREVGEVQRAVVSVTLHNPPYRDDVPKSDRLLGISMLGVAQLSRE